MRQKCQSFSADFKLEAVEFVRQQGYSVSQACRARSISAIPPCCAGLPHLMSKRLA